MRLAAAAFLLLASCAGSREARKLPSAHLENLHEIAPGVLTGAGPHGEASFRELADLGVKTVVSVDGARPDVEAAKQHGLRYVHLPIGYDGVPEERTLELAKALQELPGPVYLHCHHGKHRGPAAAAVACVVAGKIDNDQAVAVMKSMGTGEQYLGLWASARAAKPVDPAALRALDVAYREVAPVPPLADAMVHLDEAFERLTMCRKEGWKTPKDHPDVDPSHEALRAREIATEILRTDDFKERPADYRGWMDDLLSSAGDLERELRAGKTVDAEKSFERLRRSCTDCHKPYRNASKLR